jgi:hypothetical protein
MIALYVAKKTIEFSFIELVLEDDMTRTAQPVTLRYEKRYPEIFDWALNVRIGQTVMLLAPARNPDDEMLASDASGKEVAEP